MSHTPSKYQAAVYHFIEEGKGNAVVDAEQERNLVYVAYTRAKSYLGFITDYE